jgi:hypothetical protein
MRCSSGSASKRATRCSRGQSKLGLTALNCSRVICSGCISVPGSAATASGCGSGIGITLSACLRSGTRTTSPIRCGVNTTA